MWSRKARPGSWTSSASGPSCPKARCLPNGHSTGAGWPTAIRPASCGSPSRASPPTGSSSATAVTLNGLQHSPFWPIPPTRRIRSKIMPTARRFCTTQSAGGRGRWPRTSAAWAGHRMAGCSVSSASPGWVPAISASRSRPSTRKPGWRC